MYKEEAIPLITFDSSTRQYSITQEASQLIRSIENPIAVISVAGLYRTGKSYLLNRIILNRSNGFGVGPTVNPCTKGMWVWGTPIMVGNTSVLIIDSEGTGALNDSDVNHDTKIFALAVLLASTFVYNSVGPIDEGALESLGLVVNLTKFVQLKSNEEPDQEEYADYMPHFFWILRDFSLQLLDNNGDQLTANQYLERSLQEQPGFSDGVEEKNRIRRLLRTFFPERECFTLVRPVLKESQLQQLQFLDLKQLRPEFYDQAAALKKMLFNKVKPKQLHGKTLTGCMYVNLVNSYLNAINKGFIANIESSWTYVFKEECRRLQSEAYEIFERGLRDEVKLPITEEGLMEIYKSNRGKALTHMKQLQGGDVEATGEFINELKSRLRMKYNQLIQINEAESNSFCKSNLSKEFAHIERKLKQGDYKRFNDFLKDCKLFQAFLEEHGPQVARRKEIFSEFLTKNIQDASQFFIQNLQQESDKLRSQFEEQTNNLKAAFETLKADSQQKLEFQRNQLKSFQTQNAELKDMHMKSQDELERVRNLGIQNCQSIQQTHAEDIQRISSSLEDWKQKCLKLEEQLKSSEREQFILQSESKKREALLEQRVQHLTKQMDESQKKEKLFDSNLMNSKTEFNQKIKEITSHYEGKLNEIRTQNLQLNEKLQEGCDTLMQLEIKYENLLSTSQQKDEQNLITIKKLQQQLLSAQEQLNFEQKQNKRLQEDLSLAQNNSEEIEARENIKVQLKLAESKLSEQRQTQMRQEAILGQQIQFLQLELEEKKASIIDIKKSHDQALQALELSTNNNQNQTQINKSILDLKEQHMIEMRQIEQNLIQQKKQHQLQVDQLTSDLTDLELKCDLFLTEKNKLQELLQESYKLQDDLKQRISQQARDIDSNKSQQIKDKEQRLNQKIKQLEDELTLAKQNLQLQGAQHQQNIEQQINELRNYYEMEKDVLERRIHEERQKADSKYQALFEEQDSKQREEQQLYEEEIENLKEELRELELNLHAQQQQYDNELELKNKSILTLEQIQNETKEQLLSLQSVFQQQVDQRLQTYTLSISQLESQLNQSQFCAQQLSKENANLCQKIENLEIKLIQKSEENKQVKEDFDKEKCLLLEKFEDIRKKYGATCDEYLEKKINYEKSIALSAQQNEFFAKKVEELERQLEISNAKYEERYKAQKTEWNQEMAEKLQKINEEKQTSDAKLMALKKTLREKETHLLKLQQDLEKENALSSEKIKYLENKLREQEQQNSSESNSIASQLKSMKDLFGAFKIKSQSDIEQLKNQLHNSEYERQEMAANYEKDKILWLGKAQFLESQKESLKQELSENMRKFEVTISTLQKRGIERSDQNQDLSEMLTSIERKYQEKERDLLELQRIKQEEFQERIERLEKELKQHQNKELIESQNKVGQQFERRVAELLENEKRLLTSIEELKQERDQRLSEHQEEVEQEKEYWRAKLNELEERLRDSDKKHSQLIFFHEKERAKWNQEKDHMTQQRQDLQDSLQRLEKKKELLLRENEKIKNKSQRKYNGNQTYVGGGGLNSSYLRNQTSDKKLSALGIGGKEVNMSYDVTKSLEGDERREKENLSTSTQFGSFKRYYQMMNSKPQSPTRQQLQQQMNE